MGFKVMKCPACGGNLNVETDNDYIFCQYCGAKIKKDSDRIVIEHVERRIDEAEILRAKLDEKMFDQSQKSNKKSWIYPNVVGAVLLILAWIVGNFDTFSMIIRTLLILGAVAVFAFGNLNAFIESDKRRNNYRRR